LGLVPEVIVKGRATIYNGHKSIFISEENGINVMGRPIRLSSMDEKFSPKFTTSPLEISILGENKQSKIFVDNIGKISGVSKDKLLIKYNYPTEKNIERLIGKEIFFRDDVPKGSKDIILGELRNYWKVLTPEIRDELRKKANLINKISIEFVEDNYFKNYKGFKNILKDKYNIPFDYAIDNLIRNPTKIVIRANSLINNPQISYFLHRYNLISNEEYNNKILEIREK
jgi:hypothetical protein